MTGVFLFVLTSLPFSCNCTFFFPCLQLDFYVLYTAQVLLTARTMALLFCSVRVSVSLHAGYQESEVKQLNGTQPSLISLFTPVLFSQ